MEEETSKGERGVKNGQTKLDDVAAQIIEWHDREWRNIEDNTAKTIEQVLNKLVEEVGELIGANTKHQERRVDKDWLAEMVKEFGDVMVVMCVLSYRIQDLENTSWEGTGIQPAKLTPGNMLAWRWDSVRRRKSDKVRAEGNSDG